MTAVANVDNKRVTYSYDAVGQGRVMRDADGGRFIYTHHAAGQLMSLVNALSERTTWVYDAIGQNTARAFSYLQKEDQK